LSTGRLLIPLKPQDERPLALQVLEQMRPRVANIPGLNVFLQNQSVLRIGGRVSKSEFQYSLVDADMRRLLAWTPRLVERLSASNVLKDVTSDLILNNPEVRVEIDRERASAFASR